MVSVNCQPLTMFVEQLPGSVFVPKLVTGAFSFDELAEWEGPRLKREIARTCS
jgi:hypothetical protein